MLDTSSEGFPSVASTATDPAMSRIRRPVTSSNSRLVGASMVHRVISPVGIPPVLPVSPASTPNDISHFAKVKMYRERPRPEAPTGGAGGRRQREAPAGGAGRRRERVAPGRSPWPVRDIVLDLILVVVEPGEP